MARFMNFVLGYHATGTAYPVLVPTSLDVPFYVVDAMVCNGSISAFGAFAFVQNSKISIVSSNSSFEMSRIIGLT